MLLKNVFEIELMKKDNGGASLESLNHKIKMAACLYFDGCTLLESRGYWLGDDGLYNDESCRLLVSFNFDEKTTVKLLALIEMELVEGKQEAVCFAVNGITSISGNMTEVKHDLMEMLKNKK